MWKKYLGYLVAAVLLVSGGAWLGKKYKPKEVPVELPVESSVANNIPCPIPEPIIRDVEKKVIVRVPVIVKVPVALEEGCHPDWERGIVTNVSKLGTETNCYVDFKNKKIYVRHKQIQTYSEKPEWQRP